MRVFEAGTGQIRFNDTDSFWLDASGGQDWALKHAAAEITTLPTEIRRFLEGSGEEKHHRILAGQIRSAVISVEAHRDGRLLLSPFSFTTGTPFRVCRQVVDTIFELDPLAKSLLEVLGRHGVMGFIDRLRSDGAKRRSSLTMRLIMAGFAVSFGGISRIEDVPQDAFIAWLELFKQPHSSRWEGKHWSADRDVAYQCIREMTFAYGRLTGIASIGKVAAQKRSDATRIHFREDLLRNPPDHLKPWVEAFVTFRTERPGVASNYNWMLQMLCKWLNSLADHDLVSDISRFMGAKARGESFVEFVLRVRTQDGEDDPMSKTLEEMFACARRFSDYLARVLSESGEDFPAFYPLVTVSDSQKIKNELKRLGMATLPNEARASALPSRFKAIVREILEEGEQGWPGSSSLCREVVVRADGTTEEIYCPVLPALFRAMFLLPVRMAQLRRLDSGEGDLRRFDGRTMTWSANTGTLAGYWSSVGKEDQKGYAHELGGDEPLTGFFINTNKTGEPWVVPWQNEELHRILYEIREWQEKNNPVSGPIGPQDYLDKAEEFDPGAFESYPQIFPLFRLPASRRNGRQGSPPPYRRVNEFWQVLMAELEVRLQRDSPDIKFSPIVKRQRKTNQAYGARYTIHGIRSGGLTELVNQNVPLWVVSALIGGHSSIVMTMYYLKLEARQIHAMLSEAAIAQRSSEGRALAAELVGMKFDEAKRRTAVVSDDGLRALSSDNAPDGRLCADTSIGLCIYGGERCHDGGPLLRKDANASGSRNVHGPVPGGPRNCILCRHFISGPPWMAPLQLNGTRLLRKVTKISERLIKLQTETETRRDTLRKSEGTARMSLQAEIARLEVEIGGLEDEQRIAAQGAFNTKRLMEACHAINAQAAGDQQADSYKSLVTRSDHDVVNFSEVTNFEQAAMLAAAGRVYPLMYDASVEAERDAFVDEIVWRAGHTPLSMAPLDKEARRRGQEALADILWDRLDSESLEAARSGAVSLSDLGLDSDIRVALQAVPGFTERMLSSHGTAANVTIKLPPPTGCENGGRPAAPVAPDLPAITDGRRSPKHRPTSKRG